MSGWHYFTAILSCLVGYLCTVANMCTCAHSGAGVAVRACSCSCRPPPPPPPPPTAAAPRDCSVCCVCARVFSTAARLKYAPAYRARVRWFRIIFAYEMMCAYFLVCNRGAMMESLLKCVAWRGVRARAWSVPCAVCKNARLHTQFCCCCWRVNRHDVVCCAVRTCGSCVCNVALPSGVGGFFFCFAVAARACSPSNVVLLWRIHSSSTHMRELLPVNLWRSVVVIVVVVVVVFAGGGGGHSSECAAVLRATGGKTRSRNAVEIDIVK